MKIILHRRHTAFGFFSWSASNIFPIIAQAVFQKYIRSAILQSYRIFAERIHNIDELQFFFSNLLVSDSRSKINKFG